MCAIIFVHRNLFKQETLIFDLWRSASPESNLAKFLELLGCELTWDGGCGGEKTTHYYAHLYILDIVVDTLK